MIGSTSDVFASDVFCSHSGALQLRFIIWVQKCYHRHKTSENEEHLHILENMSSPYAEWSLQPQPDRVLAPVLAIKLAFCYLLLPHFIIPSFYYPSSQRKNNLEN